MYRCSWNSIPGIFQWNSIAGTRAIISGGITGNRTCGANDDLCRDSIIVGSKGCFCTSASCMCVVIFSPRWLAKFMVACNSLSPTVCRVAAGRWYASGVNPPSLGKYPLAGKYSLALGTCYYLCMGYVDNDMPSLSPATSHAEAYFCFRDSCKALSFRVPSPSSAEMLPSPGITPPLPSLTETSRKHKYSTHVPLLHSLLLHSRCPSELWPRNLRNNTSRVQHCIAPLRVQSVVRLTRPPWLLRLLPGSFSGLCPTSGHCQPPIPPLPQRRVANEVLVPSVV